ncbi:MAG TPA: hypothetical protein VD884_13780 [Ohtaekwangia sp.]|nr:hypothetical protein [Ohtaekwangia sp.]
MFLLNPLYLKRNWTISVYSLFYSGEPYTPSSVQFVGENGERQVLFYDLKRKNSKRLPAFYSMDIRFDKFWYFKKWHLNFYVNLINVTGHKNLRNYYWTPYPNDQGNYDVSQREELYLSNVFVSPGISINF